MLQVVDYVSKLFFFGNDLCLNLFQIEFEANLTSMHKGIMISLRCENIIIIIRYIVEVICTQLHLALASCYANF